MQPGVGFAPTAFHRPRNRPLLPLARAPKDCNGPLSTCVCDTLAFMPLLSLRPIREAVRPSGWQGQQLDPPYHRREEPSRQMALRQQKPVISGVLHQPAARTDFSDEESGGRKVSQTPVKRGIVSSISSFREPKTGPLWGPWSQAVTLTRPTVAFGAARMYAAECHRS
jgi:hypothetical protein